MSAVEGDTRTSRPPATRNAQMQLGQLLRQDGKLSEEDVQRVLLAQIKHPQQFGDAALRLELVSEPDVQHALSKQFAYYSLGSEESAFAGELVAAYQPFGRPAEALRALRTQLMLRWFGDDNNKILAVVAPRSGQGCSVLAANLAIMVSQLDQRTLLIDANLRQPRQHALFGLKPRIGLTNLLAGRGSFKDATIPVEPFDNLSVLCAGSLPPNPQELLGRVSFAYLMETAPAAYDAIIVDTPPVLEYADAQIVAAKAGGCLVVTRRHRTRISDVQNTQVALQPTGAKILGAVIGE